MVVEEPCLTLPEWQTGRTLAQIIDGDSRRWAVTTGRGIVETVKDRKTAEHLTSQSEETALW